MIHACKSLYNLLPNFVSYTKMLAGIAYATRDAGNPLAELHAQLWPLLGHPRGVDWPLLERDSLQYDVSTSSWLRTSHLRKLHHFLLAKLVELQLIENPSISMSGSKKFKLGQMVGRLNAFRNAHCKDEISVKVKSPDTGTWNRASVILYDHCIAILGKIPHDWSVTVYELLSIKCIPNCLIDHDPAEDARMQIETIEKPSSDRS